jgi:hypothetical protein
MLFCKKKTNVGEHMVYRLVKKMALGKRLEEVNFDVKYNELHVEN